MRLTPGLACRSLFAAALLAAVAAAHAAGALGILGRVYPIDEPDALESIQARLQRMEKTGDLARLQQVAVAQSLDSLQHPAPVGGVGTVTKRATRYFDPSVVLTQPIADQDGREIVPAGQRINPLDHVSLTSRLVFFDGRDEQQVEAVHRMLKAPGRLKPILVAGSWLDLTRAWKSQVFYDQFGALSRRLAIARVPSVVSQDGKRLKIDEIPPDELR